MYAAEAFCMLNQPAQALVHLAPSVAETSCTFSLYFGSPFSTQDNATHSFNQQAAPVFRSILHHNLAVTRLLQADDFQQVQQSITQAQSAHASASAFILPIQVIPKTRYKFQTSLGISRAEIRQHRGSFGASKARKSNARQTTKENINICGIQKSHSFGHFAST